VIVCDLGDDSLLVFNPPKIGVLTPQKFSARKGSGPRHVAFHPNGKWMYCIHELDCTIDLFDWSVAGTVASLTLRENSVISTLAPGVTAGEGAGRNTACEILISPDGQFAYACTRFVDEITVYRIDQKTGLLTEQQRLTAGGRIPRIIAFDPSRRWLVACNQGLGPNPVGNLAVFAHDPRTGHVDPKPLIFAADTPMFVQWL
jgi:6-phosphogluconolactonase